MLIGRFPTFTSIYRRIESELLQGKRIWCVVNSGCHFTRKQTSDDEAVISACTYDSLRVK